MITIRESSSIRPSGKVNHLHAQKEAKHVKSNFKITLIFVCKSGRFPHKAFVRQGQIMN
jgi:hypothetical protein